MNAEQQAKLWGQIVTKASQDENFRQRLLADPANVVKEFDVELPAGVQLRVVENTDQVLHLALPPLAASRTKNSPTRSWKVWPVDLLSSLSSASCRAAPAKRTKVNQGRNLPPSHRPREVPNESVRLSGFSSTVNSPQAERVADVFAANFL